MKGRSEDFVAPPAVRLVPISNRQHAGNWMEPRNAYKTGQRMQSERTLTQSNKLEGNGQC
eukprot:115469-Amphidinium_carterae.1